MIKRLVFLLLISILTINLYSKELDTNRDGFIDVWIYTTDEGFTVASDTDFNGIEDAYLYLNPKRIPIFEETDYNLDGVCDNFYYYEEGITVRQEIDSNYDGDIDVWVYISEDGKSVKRYEKDTDYDGIPDKIKEFKGTEEDNG